MFLNKNLLTKSLKFSKYGFESRLDAPPLRFGAKPVCNLKCSKKLVFISTKVNGLQETLLVCKKLPVIKSNGKSMTQFLGDKCWKCKEVLKMKEFSCALCGALQYPKPNINFFQLFGISQVYDIDLEDLSKKFRNMQMIFHPDKFTNKSKEELEISEYYSRLLNKAYTTLKDPSSRGFYLLELHKVLPDAHPLEKDFLMTMMDKNEELETIDKPSVLEKFMKNNDEAIVKQINLVKEAFQANQLESAKIHLLELNYFINLDTKIKEKQNNLNNLSDK